MKKFVAIVVMVCVVFAIGAFAEPERIELTFADDFKYRDDERLSTYGYEYDDGSIECFIDIGESFVVRMTYVEETGDIHYEIVHHLKDYDNLWWEEDISLMNYDELDEHLLETRIGSILNLMDREGWA